MMLKSTAHVLAWLAALGAAAYLLGELVTVLAIHVAGTESWVAHSVTALLALALIGVGLLLCIVAAIWELGSRPAVEAELEAET